MPARLERRRHPRIACELPVRVHDGRDWIDATTNNVSLGGMLLRVQSPLPAGSQWSIHCVLEGALRLHAMAEVIRRDEASGEVAVAFSQLAPRAIDDLRRELQRRQAAAL